MTSPPPPPPAPQPTTLPAPRRSRAAVAAVVLALLVLGSAALGPRRVTVSDALTARSLHESYRVTFPWTRVLLEPWSGLAFHAFDRELEFVPLALLAAIVCRLLLDRRRALDRRLLAGVRLSGLLIAVALALACAIMGWVHWSRGLLAVERMGMRALIWSLRAGLLASACALAFRVSRPLAADQTGAVRRGLRVVGEVAGATALSVAVGVTLLSLPLPTWRIAADLRPGELLCDLHVHTDRTDGFLSPANRVRWYAAQGIHAAAFSDHHDPEGSADALAAAEGRADGFVVIPAIEYTCNDPYIHLNAFGYAQPLHPPHRRGDPAVDETLTAQEMIARVHAAGGLVSVNHYHRRDGVPSPSLDELAAWGADFVEVWNPEMARYGLEFGSSVEAAQRGLMVPIAGSDTHDNQPLRSFVRVRVDGTAPPAEAILRALLRGFQQVVRIDRPDPLFDHRTDSRVRPLLRFATYLRDLSLPQRLSWLAWIALAVGVLRGLEQRARRQDDAPRS